MATIYFSLSAKSDYTNKKEVLLRFSHGRINQRAKTNIFVPSEFWENIYSDTELEKAKADPSHAPVPLTGKIKIPNFRLRNDEQEALIKSLSDKQGELDDLKKSITDLFNETDKSAIAPDWLKVEVDKISFPEKYVPEIELPKIQTLFQFLDKFITELPQRKDKETGRILTYGTMQNYRTVDKQLREFVKIVYKKDDIAFEDINQKFYDDFVSYFQNKEITTKNKEGKEESRGFALNTIGKKIRVLKTMLGEATNQEYNTNQKFKKFRTFSEDADTVYLNEAELEQLKNTDLSKTPCLERVRDCFLVLCWTGCRHSDLEKISKTDIKDNFITFRQQKTNNKVTIPLHPIVLEILEKYDYKLPDASNQKFNDYVKEGAEIAKINNKETTTRTEGGKLVTKESKKWELISSHTGRRSFCTNMYKRGLPTLMIMSISGHTTEKAFLKYIKVKQEEHAQMMAERWTEMYGTPTSKPAPKNKKQLIKKGLTD